MISKKKIVVLAAVLVSVLVVGVYAYANLLSNTLTANWTVTTGTPLTASFNAAPTGGTTPWGTYDYFGVRVQNPTAATLSGVYVTFTLTDSSAMPSGSFHIQYFDGTNWDDVGVAGWLTYGTGTVSGTLWNIGTVAPAFDKTLQFRIMFDSTMPTGIVSAAISCVQ